MKTLAKYIQDVTPKFNKRLVEGFSYHRLKHAIKYIDSFIRYSCTGKTSTYLQYLGYEEVSPKEEIKYLFNKTSKVIHDIAENDIYLVKFLFRYGNEEDIREYYFYVPYLHKGNIIRLSGNKFLVMPVLSDKVISIGDKIIFINILTAKYNFTRTYFSVVVNGIFRRVPIINTELYKNQVKKLEDTTKANPTIMHYMLANYGYTKTMEMLLGHIPTPVYDYDSSDKVLIESTGNPPQGFIKNKNIYEPNRIKFIVDEDKYTEETLYYIGNIFYILDNFTSVEIHDLDNTLVWKRLLGEIIHSGNHGLSYLNEKISAHFNDLNSMFDVVTISKLNDIGVQANTLMELLSIILRNYNNWIMNSDSRSLYNSKSYEVESFILSHLTSRVTRIALDINKEELRIGGNVLDSKIVDKIFKKYFVTRAIFNMKKDKLYVTSIEYCGDHLYFKNTSMVVQQESDFVNIKTQDINTSERKKIVASMATIGSILGLSKKNPTPLVRSNPYINIDFNTGTVLPHPLYNDIITNTDRLLASIDINSDIVDGDSESTDDIVSEIDTDEDSHGVFDDSFD